MKNAPHGRVFLWARQRDLLESNNNLLRGEKRVIGKLGAVCAGALLMVGCAHRAEVGSTSAAYEVRRDRVQTSKAYVAVSKDLATLDKTVKPAMSAVRTISRLHWDRRSRPPSCARFPPHIHRLCRSRRLRRPARMVCSTPSLSTSSTRACGSSKASSR